MTDPKLVTLAGNIELSASATGKNFQNGCLCFSPLHAFYSNSWTKIQSFLLTLVSFQTCMTSLSFQYYYKEWEYQWTITKNGNTSEQVSV